MSTETATALREGPRIQVARESSGVEGSRLQVPGSRFSGGGRGRVSRFLQVGGGRGGKVDMWIYVDTWICWKKKVVPSLSGSSSLSSVSEVVPG